MAEEPDQQEAEVTAYCTCETYVFDPEYDAGCRRCGLPIDFTPVECERCAVWRDKPDYKPVAATTYQEHREESDPEHWPNTVTLRCDECARALRDYARLPRMSLRIVVDRPIEPRDRAKARTR